MSKNKSSWELEMITLNQIRSRLKSRKRFLLKRYQVASLAVFGSFVNGKPNSQSDVDILIDFKKTPDLFEFLQIESYLEKVLGRRVDLVRKKALRKELAQVLDEAVKI